MIEQLTKAGLNAGAATWVAAQVAAGDKDLDTWLFRLLDLRRVAALNAEHAEYGQHKAEIPSMAQIQSDAGTPMIVRAAQSGQQIYFSTDISKARACWDTRAGDWMPLKGEFGHSMKAKIAKAFGLRDCNA